VQNDASPQETPKSIHRFWIWLQGAFVSNVCGFVCVAILTIVGSGFNWKRLGQVGEWTSGTLSASTFLVVPFAIGFCAALFWKRADLSKGARFGWTMGNLALSLLGASVALREGALCLVMAAPLLLGLMWAGSACGAVFWARNSFLSASVLPLLLVVLVGDAASPHSFREAVSTEVHSHQPPEKLWRYVASYPRNDAPPNFWLWQLGLSYPVEANGEPKIGGRRDCRFSGDVSIGERVVSAQPNRKLEFIVDKQANHPEVVGHFALERGRLELLPDGRGGTIMRGTSWYELKVYPAFYFAPWTRSIIHHVHRRVFEHMDRLAKRD
jgi:hypothetical protein